MWTIFVIFIKNISWSYSWCFRIWWLSLRLTLTTWIGSMNWILKDVRIERCLFTDSDCRCILIKLWFVACKILDRCLSWLRLNVSLMTLRPLFYSQLGFSNLYQWPDSNNLLSILGFYSMISMNIHIFQYHIQSRTLIKAFINEGNTQGQWCQYAFWLQA